MIISSFSILNIFEKFHEYIKPWETFVYDKTIIRYEKKNEI